MACTSRSMRRVSRHHGRGPGLCWALILGGVALAGPQALALAQAGGGTAACARPLYLTFDTGSQSQAVVIHDILKKHGVLATFFLANEKTVKADWSLDPSWAPYWRDLVAEGHAFGTHTFDHVYYRGPAGEGAVKMRPQFGAQAGKVLTWNGAQVCAELNRVRARFAELTGAQLDPFWRAPGGKTSATLNGMGEACGYRHFGWSDAGFLGDELPSSTWPNERLVERALKNIRPGDVLMAHLGIRSREQAFAPALDPLIAGLKERGFCFRTLRDYPGTGPAPATAAQSATKGAV